MRYQLTVLDRELAVLRQTILGKVKEVKGQVEGAMAEKFQECVLANFGATGLFRPWSGWAPLSPAYAKKVGRTYATLEVSGRLKQNVLIESRGEHVEVTSSDERVPYATVHQFGGGNSIPAREYFPIGTDGEVTRQVQDLVVEAAHRKLAEILN